MQTRRLALRALAIGTATVALATGCADHADQSTSQSAAGIGGFGPGGAGTAGMGCGVGPAGTAGASGGSASPIAPTFETVKLVIQGGGPIMTCAAAPCHGVNGNAPPGRPLALPSNDDQLLYTNLTSFVSTACGNVRLVVPCDPAGSALPRILSGPCGTTPRMPYMCTTQDGNCIPDEYIAAIRQWIANGAPR